MVRAIAAKLRSTALYLLIRLACHCSDCQKFSGAPFRAVAVMSAEQVAISGVVKEYLKIADSGNERVQGFCSE